MATKRGTYKQIGEAGDWTQNHAITISENEIISIDSLGDLWATDCETAKSRLVNNYKYTSSRFLLSTKNEIYSIDRDGTFGITNTKKGTYKQIRDFASYSHTVAAVMCGVNLISIGESGSCYESYLDGSFKKINEDNFSNVKFIFSGETLFFIIENNTLYSVNPQTGGYKKLGNDGDYANVVLGTGFNDKVIVLENTGLLWEIDGITGAYSKVSETTFLDTKKMVGADNFIYTIEPTGCLYKIAL